MSTAETKCVQRDGEWLCRLRALLPQGEINGTILCAWLPCV